MKKKAKMSQVNRTGITYTENCTKWKVKMRQMPYGEFVGWSYRVHWKSTRTPLGGGGSLK